MPHRNSEALSVLSGCNTNHAHSKVKTFFSSKMTTYFPQEFDKNKILVKLLESLIFSKLENTVKKYDTSLPLRAS